MMVRTQITMDPETQRHARTRAAQMGISVAEYVRRLVARDLGGGVGGADPSLVFDLGDSGGSNVAVGKDQMVGEAVAAQRSRSRARR